MKKITVKRSDVFGENETSDELRRQKQKDGRDFSYRSGHSKVIDSEHLQKNIHLSIKNHKAIRISIVTTMNESRDESRRTIIFWKQKDSRYAGGLY